MQATHFTILNAEPKIGEVTKGVGSGSFVQASQGLDLQRRPSFGTNLFFGGWDERFLFLILEDDGSEGSTATFAAPTWADSAAVRVGSRVSVESSPAEALLAFCQAKVRVLLDGASFGTLLGVHVVESPDVVLQLLVDLVFETANLRVRCSFQFELAAVVVDLDLGRNLELVCGIDIPVNTSLLVVDLEGLLALVELEVPAGILCWVESQVDSVFVFVQSDVHLLFGVLSEDEVGQIVRLKSDMELTGVFRAHAGERGPLVGHVTTQV